MRNKHRLLFGLLVACLLCPALPGDGQAAAKKKTKTKDGIAYVRISLPEEVEWEVNPDEKLARGGIIQWLVAGYSAKDTPAKVLYQQVKPAKPAGELQMLIDKSLDDCPDVDMGPFQGSSKYHDQINIEAICSRLGEERFGVQSFISIFSDNEANHVVIAEVRTPVAEKAGELNYRNPVMKQQVETSRVFSDLLYKLMHDIRVCDAKDLCI